MPIPQHQPNASSAAPAIDLPGFKRPHAKPDPVTPRQTGNTLTPPPPPVGKPARNNNARQTTRPKKTTPTKAKSANNTSAPTAETINVSDIHQRRQDKQFNIQLQRLRSLAKTVAFILVMAALWYGVSGLQLYKTPYTSLSPATQTRLTSPVALAHALETMVAKQPNPYAWLLTPSNHYETQLKQQLPFVYQASVQPQLLPNRLAVTLQEIPPWAILHAAPKAKPAPPSTDGKPTAAVKKPLPISQRLHTLAPIGYMVANQAAPGNIATLTPPAQQRLIHYQHHPSQPIVNIIVGHNALPSATPLPWVEIKALAQWLHTLPRWQHAWLDCSIPNTIIIRHAEGPDVIVGPLNHDWEKRFARLGTLLPYWQGWANTIDAIDLRWPTQITLQPKPGQHLPPHWQQLLATPSDANKL